MKVDSDLFSDYLVESQTQYYAFDPNEDFETYRKKVREKFLELIGIAQIKKNECPAHMEIVSVEDKGTYTQTRFLVETERNNIVPCYLLLPKTGKKKYPVCICLQGHTNGMYISLGEKRVEEPDTRHLKTHAFGIQAVEHGFAAICIEQRAMGEQKAFRENRKWDEGARCKFLGFTALTMGRTLCGERCYDVSKVIDVLPSFGNLDTDDIMITGCSGGGTASFYAACYDERIKLAAPDCSFCPYKESILSMYHCICNYIPHAYEWFDMQDLSVLIAPRKLLIMAGVNDPIFPIDGVRRGFKTCQSIFEKAGCPENLCKIETPTAHDFHPEMCWEAIMKMHGELK